jgi:putative redox protein
MVMDLPESKNGDDLGPSALEVCVMGLSGCVGTIYSMVASKMRLTLESLVVDVDAEKGPNDPTITKVDIQVTVKSEASEAKLQKCLDVTMNTCPVGVLYKNAGVEMNIELTKS